MKQKREGRTPAWNFEWHWPVKSGKKKEKKKKQKKEGKVKRINEMKKLEMEYEN